MRTRNFSSRGFSLMDGMITVLLMAIVAGLTIQPFFEGLQTYRLEASAQKVASELQTARAMAQASGSIHEVTVNSSQGTVQITSLADPTNPIRTSKSLEDGCVFATAPSTPIRFFPRGYARPAIIEIKKDDRSITIEIKASGRTVVQTMDDGSDSG